ncbi:hypothetical protein EBR21_02590 [bacterium]|nr:hypothetical protein [bacterium]
MPLKIRVASWLSACVVSLVLFAWLPSSARAEWNTSTIQVTGGNCLIRETRIDDTKLTLLFDDFTARLDSRLSTPSNVRETCETSVVFRLPANRRLKTLSHRVIASAEKDQLSEVTLRASVEMAGGVFSSLGRLPLYSVYSGRLLLYKSFDLARSSGCSEQERQIKVKASWILQIDAVPGDVSSGIGLTGEDQRVDLWVDTESC